MGILRNHSDASDSVLDVGTGAGFVAQRLQYELGAEVHCLDVVDLNQTDLPITLFDGENIPFENNRFNVSLGLCMLHHAKESFHIHLLSEMKRVTSSKIIISEDIVFNGLDRGLQKCHEIQSKTDFKSDKLSFKSQAGWERLFERIGLEVSDVISVPRGAIWWYPIPRCYFVLST